MRKLKNFSQFILENKKEMAFEPHYFNLPYSIPEDRFEDGLLKSNTSRKTSNRRSFNEGTAKYSSIDEFFEKNPIAKIEKYVLAEINKVIKFINNNKLTGREIVASFDQELELSEYLDRILKNPEEDILFGMISTNLPLSLFAIRVDYDVYKNIPVFTFWFDGDLFYYYSIFTLEPNDVSGSGENHTYITADEVIDHLFYDYLWRVSFYELAQMEVDPTDLGFSESEFYDLAEANINDSNQIVDNYFDKRFVKLIRHWIKTGDPYLTTNKKSKFDYFTIPSFGMMSFPGNSGRLLKMSQGPKSNDYTIRLLSLEPDSGYLAIKFNYDEYGITLIESGEYSMATGWNGVNWKPLSKEEVNTLYFIDSNGDPKWIKNLMN